MTKRQEGRTQAQATAVRKEEWIKPEVDIIHAGGAEGSTGPAVDAADLTS